ncbi:MAG: trypsin-like peptidase domain-containing protein [Sphingobacteriales bacterium]|nr:trypsin-like peptidase domain-containing protein [Sphingobacteriales bacterium]
MKLKQLLLIVAVSAVSAVSSVWIYSKVVARQHATAFSQSADGKVPANYAGFLDNAANPVGEATDFTKAANAAVPAVVHIKTKIPAKKISNQLPRGKGNGFDDFFDQFFNFGPQIQPEQRASGSGVIISDDGYIVTNNHVISDGGQGVADEITVTLSNKKTYKAKVIGKDASSDIAVLKIDGTGFPFLLYGNSDNVKLGQWVLAIGYPLTLETTVTAGIISAKGRSIGINGRQSENPIESFIQTDAAVNQGNSGGALITTEGQLIGINSAIYAPTGTYAGYSFAIPVNLVKKIVNDLIKFGDVKRPYLGIAADQTRITSTDGAYIGSVAPDGAAANAGLKKGDIIKKINEVNISSWSELQGTVASLNTGDKVSITYKRDGKEFVTNATLKAEQGTYENLAASNLGNVLGADLENLDKKIAQKNEMEGGVLVKKIRTGGPFSKTRMQDGFIITSVNGVEVKNVDELSRAIGGLRGESLNLEGFYDGYDGMYRYPVNLQLEDE